MKFILSIIAMAFFAIATNAQVATTCKDSSRIPDTFFQCGQVEYEPVCGCDNLTYRNACAAEYWGGLLNNGFYKGWTDNTVCGNFDFDFTPTGITYFPVQFSLYSKFSGSATLYVYNRYGALMYADYFNISTPDFITTRQIDFQSLPIGIYIAVVVMNGEQQHKKIGKVYNSFQ